MNHGNITLVSGVDFPLNQSIELMITIDNYDSNDGWLMIFAYFCGVILWRPLGPP